MKIDNDLENPKSGPLVMTEGYIALDIEAWLGCRPEWVDMKRVYFENRGVFISQEHGVYLGAIIVEAIV